MQKNCLNHNGCDILSVMVKKERHHIMDDKVFASRHMSEAMSLNDKIETIGVVDIFAVDDAQKSSFFP